MNHSASIGSTRPIQSSHGYRTDKAKKPSSMASSGNGSYYYPAPAKPKMAANPTGRQIVLPPQQTANIQDIKNTKKGPESLSRRGTDELSGSSQNASKMSKQMATSSTAAMSGSGYSTFTNLGPAKLPRKEAGAGGSEQTQLQP